MAVHEDHYALVVGIDHYPKYRSLQGACADAREFSAWLLDDETGGGLPEDNIRQVLSTPDPVRPIQETVDDALEEIFRMVKDHPGERLYVYFSGHGLARDNLCIDLCMAKWSKARRGRALDFLDYRKLLLGSGHFREVAMFLDCCRVRQVGGRALGCTLGLSRPGDNAASSRSFIGYATEFLNPAFEADSGDGEEEDVRGHFTVALLEALKGKAADATGGVRASRLKDYLDVHTPVIAKKSNHLQRPEVINGFGSVREPIFGNAFPPAPLDAITLQITMADHRAGEILLEDQNLDPVRRGDARSGPWSVPVKRGLYLLRELGTGSEQSIRVTGDANEVIHVEF